jgi:1-acyl-sn-glycerol-3-phosphate acyltransferase
MVMGESHERKTTSELFELETWRGLWFLLSYALRLQADVIQRRFTGEYETDEWGWDWELVESVIPFANLLYSNYWRVQTSGVENLPATGAALLVSNHSGPLPWDWLMLGTAVWNEHPAQRTVRALYNPALGAVPFLAPLLVKLGHAPATVENGVRLLMQGELVAIFPEGPGGLSKRYQDRYQLVGFGRGAFVKMALASGAPIIPVTVVGGEETYITLGGSERLARLAGLPYFPITARFPWLGPLGLVPLPSRWQIEFGPEIPTTGYGPEADKDPLLLSRLTDQVRNVIQKRLDEKLAERKSIFR